MSRAVLDASALLAVLFREPGEEAARGYLPDSLLSAVNLSEVVTKAVDAGMMLEEAQRMLAGFPCEIVPFDGEHAYLTGSLRAGTRRFGLSLGDRACLALALARSVPAVTAERQWEACDVGVKIIRVR